jgi:hypothetical protein
MEISNKAVHRSGRDASWRVVALDLNPSLPEEDRNITFDLGNLTADIDAAYARSQTALDTANAATTTAGQANAAAATAVSTANAANVTAAQAASQVAGAVSTANNANANANTALSVANGISAVQDDFVTSATATINNAASQAIAFAGISTGYQSWTTANPTTSGAVNGTRGSRLSADGNIELLLYNGSAWTLVTTLVASTSWVHPRLVEVRTAAFSSVASAKTSTTLLESFEVNSTGEADRFIYKIGATETGDDVTVITRGDGRKYLSEKYIRRKSFGDGVNLLDAGVKLSNTPLQNSQAIDKLMDDLYGYSGGGKIIIPQVGRIDIGYSIMPKYDNFTFEGYGAGSWLHNANPTAAFWMADTFTIGNFGEPSYPRLWNAGEFRNLQSITANTNKVTMSTLGDVAGINLAVGNIVLITSNYWAEAALLASRNPDEPAGTLRYTAPEAAAHAAACTGIMGMHSSVAAAFTPLFSDLNEIVRIDGADIYLRYPIPIAVTNPRIVNMNRQNVQLFNSFGYSGNTRNLVAQKNITIRNMRISTNPANLNGFAIQASSIVGCLFENLYMESRGMLYGNFQCHSMFRNIQGTFYDAFADLKVGPYDTVYEDVSGTLIPNPLFFGPSYDWNVLWSPDVRALYTTFNRVKCYARGHPGSLRLGGRHMTYRDCEFFSSATEMIVIPSGSDELPAGVGNPENQIVHFRKMGSTAPLRHINASGGRDIEITIDEIDGANPSSNLAAFTSPAENIRVKMPIYPNASLAVSTGINCWVEEIMPRGLYRRRTNPGNITSTTVNNVVETRTVRGNTLSKNGRVDGFVKGRGSGVTGGTSRLTVAGTQIGIVNLSASENFKMEFSIYARTETINQEWDCTVTVNGVAVAYTHGQFSTDISTADFNIELQAWRASGTLNVSQFDTQAIPAVYGV